MSQINFEIFNEYKSVDKFCKECYSSEKGVTTYIDYMNNVSVSESSGIPNWNETKSMLIRIRKLRNDMAHEDGAFEYADGTQTDLDWLKEFHIKLLNQSDPLCLWYKKKNELNSKNKSANNNQEIGEKAQTDKRKDSNIKTTGGGCLAAMITFAVMATALLTVIGMFIIGFIFIPI